MAEAALPIQFQEHLNLTAIGIPQEAIGFNSCTLESDHYIWYGFTSHILF